MKSKPVNKKTLATETTRNTMQTRDYLDNADALMARIKQGALLTVMAG